jgi:hypothetical protein
LKIDNLEVPESVIGCWKDQLDKAGDADLEALCKQHKDLWAGFRPGKTPGLLGLCSEYPTRSVVLWFDGPVVQERALASNLRVRFSRGTGTDRADQQIAAYLMHLQATYSHQMRAVVSADGAVAGCANSSGALVLLPVEFGHWIT